MQTVWVAAREVEPDIVDGPSIQLVQVAHRVAQIFPVLMNPAIRSFVGLYRYNLIWYYPFVHIGAAVGLTIEPGHKAFMMDFQEMNGSVGIFFDFDAYCVHRN